MLLRYVNISFHIYSLVYWVLIMGHLLFCLLGTISHLEGQLEKAKLEAAELRGTSLMS